MRIGAVILHYNRIDLTVACAASLVAQEEPLARIVVVDNGSSDHAPETLAEALPQGVETLRNETNLGFAAANNRGIRHLLADPSVEAVLLLNNDTRCPRGLTCALTAAARRPGIGVVGCEMVNVQGGAMVAAGSDLAPFFAFPVAPRDRAAPMYLQGACLLIPRTTLDTVGLLDERYHFFFEDADYGLRIRAAGLTPAVADGVRIEHLGSATIGASGRRQAAWYREGAVTFLRRWRSHPLARALGPFVFRLAVDALRGRWGAVRGSLEGWRAGWRHDNRRV